MTATLSREAEAEERRQRALLRAPSTPSAEDSLPYTAQQVCCLVIQSQVVPPHALVLSWSAAPPDRMDLLFSAS